MSVGDSAVCMTTPDKLLGGFEGHAATILVDVVSITTLQPAGATRQQEMEGSGIIIINLLIQLGSE